MSTATDHLQFGYNAGLPVGVRAAWGARLIVSQDGFVDAVWDRQSSFGDNETWLPLQAWVNGGAFEAALDRLSEYLRSGDLSTRERREVVLFADERGLIVGNPLASAGYVYVAAWLREHAS